MNRVALACVLLTGGALARADVPKLAPNLYERGNLRVAVACAGSPLVGPAGGLRVSIDGSALEPLRVNAELAAGTDADGYNIVESFATDTGFLAEPGRHHLEVDAPGCEPDVRDVDLSATYAERVEGRLPALPELRAPTAAPDGFGFVFGAASLPFPATLASGTSSDGLAPTAYTTDPSSAQGLWVSMQFERDHLMFATDEMATWGSLSGTVTSMPSTYGVATGTYHYSGSYLENAVAVRFGGRVSFGDASLAGGTGVGGALVTRNSAHVDAMSSTEILPNPPKEMDADWWVPVWAAVTVKPSCDWGVQALASYDVRPTQLDANGVAFGLGLEWQGSSACSEPAGIRVAP